MSLRYANNTLSYHISYLFVCSFSSSLPSRQYNPPHSPTVSLRPWSRQGTSAAIQISSPLQPAAHHSNIPGQVCSISTILKTRRSLSTMARHRSLALPPCKHSCIDLRQNHTSHGHCQGQTDHRHHNHYRSHLSGLCLSVKDATGPTPERNPASHSRRHNITRGNIGRLAHHQSTLTRATTATYRKGNTLVTSAALPKQTRGARAGRADPGVTTMVLRPTCEASLREPSALCAHHGTHTAIYNTTIGVCNR